MEHLRVLHEGYDALSNYDKVRLLRQYGYERIILAATSEAHLARNLLTGALSDVFDAFARHEGGAWCGTAARILMKLYLEAGFRAWKYTYGAGSPVTHSVTLVEVDGHVYLQDAYFNTDYVSEDGRPLPFFDVLERLRLRRPPGLRQDPGIRKGLFESEANAREWVSAGLQDTIVCQRLSPQRVLCQFPMRFEAYTSNYYKSREVTAWLAAAGYSNDWSYLMLHPRRDQKFLSVPRGMFHAPLAPDHEMELSIARAVTLPLVDRPEAFTSLDAAVNARLEYLKNREDQLRQDIVSFIDENRRLRASNEHLQTKLASVRNEFRVKLAKARAKR